MNKLVFILVACMGSIMSLAQDSTKHSVLQTDRGSYISIYPEVLGNSAGPRGENGYASINVEYMLLFGKRPSGVYLRSGIAPGGRAKSYCFPSDPYVYNKIIEVGLLLKRKDKNKYKDVGLGYTSGVGDGWDVSGNKHCFGLGTFWYVRAGLRYQTRSGFLVRFAPMLLITGADYAPVVPWLGLTLGYSIKLKSNL